jgi:hypothetical protein
MSASNNFDIASRNWIGVNGDVVTNGGLLLITGTRLFPQGNTVYVDSNWATLSGRGILAFENLKSALESFNVGQPSQLRYGTPSSSNACAILVGPGTFTHNGDATLQNDYLNIYGQGKDTSFIVGVGGAGIFSVANNVVIDGLNLLGQNGFWTYSTNPIVKDCIIRGGTYGCRIQDGWKGRFIGCDFAGGANNVNFFGGGEDNGGNIVGSFENCRFMGGVGISISISLGNNNLKFKDCEWYECTNAVYMSAHVTGSFINCLIYNVAGGNSDGAITVAANKNNASYFKDCTIISNRPCFSRLTSGSVIDGCYLKVSGNNNDISAITGVANGVVFRHSTILGDGTGVAIFGYGVSGAPVSGLVTHCSLRCPSGNVPGSSIININNLAIGEGSSNEEFPAGVRL